MELSKFDREKILKIPSCQKISFSIEIPTMMKVSTNSKADLNNPGPHCRGGTTATSAIIVLCGGV